MGQKVNPKGFRIGLNSLWSTESQSYGKNFKTSKHLIEKLHMTNIFLRQYLNSKELVEGQKEIRVLENKWSYCLHYLPTHSKVNSNIKNISKELSHIFNKQLQFKKYNILFWHQSGTLLCEFVKNSIKKGVPFRKIINIIQQVLSTKEKHQIISKMSSGVKLLQFTGLKIRYAGRFGGSRSRMASSIVHKMGAVSLQKIENHIEFYETRLYTKQGVCNLQVWMAYKIVQEKVHNEKI